MPDSDAYVTLRGGVVFSRAVLDLALGLEAREITLEVSATGELLARPARALTEADIVAIRYHKHALIALVRYVHQGAAAYQRRTSTRKAWSHGPTL